MSATAERLRASAAAAGTARLRVWWSAAGATRTANSLLLTAVVTVLNVIGLVMVMSASSVQSIDLKGDAWWFFERQLLWTILGAAAFVVVSRIDYRAWRRITIPFLVVAIALLVIVLVPGIGVWVDGSRRWLGWGSWRMQPSELAKLALLIYAADVLTRRQRELTDWRRALRPIVLVYLLVAGLIMREPDLASTMVVSVIVGAVLVIGGIRARHLAVLFTFVVGAVTAFALLVPWRRARMLAFLDPWHDTSNTGYQVTQSLIAIGSGGWTGVGLGASRAKWRFLPAAHTDFIFAIVGEELGLLGAGVVVGMFLLLAFLGVRTAIAAPDRFGTLLAGGITAWIVVQALINICGTIGMLPVTGIPLPFVSFGGTALLFTMAAAGLLTNVARQGGPNGQAQP